MVIASGIAASLVPRPSNMRIEQINSAKTAKEKEITSPKPNGSAKVISSFPKNWMSLGIPWVNIKTEMPILKINSPRSTFLKFKFVE